MTNISSAVVVGLGYIGLPTAAALATRGVDVTGVDTNPEVVAAVNRGEVPSLEPDLAVAVSGAVRQGRLRASTSVPPADAYIVAVPTPFRGDKSADLSHVEAATRAIAPQLRGGEVVILESTSPPGATEQIGRWLLEDRPDLVLPGTDDGGGSVSLAHCPERVLPGRIMIEIVTNDRVVGGLTPSCAEHAADVYRIFCKGRIVLTDARTAELTKLVENAYRDVNIAFANELSAVCDKVGVDVWSLIELANHHPRVDILRPGPGVGGHCIAVDPWFLVAAAPEATALVRTAREVNDAKPGRVVQQVIASLHGKQAPLVVCLGLAFKADVDDLRESPAMQVVGALAAAMPGGRIRCVEPHVEHLPTALVKFPHVELAQAAATAVAEADAVVVLVDHSAFRGLAKPAPPVTVVDTRGMWR